MESGDNQSALAGGPKSQVRPVRATTSLDDRPVDMPVDWRSNSCGSLRCFLRDRRDLVFRIRQRILRTIPVKVPSLGSPVAGDRG
jgi:hypothetical protein